MLARSLGTVKQAPALESLNITAINLNYITTNGYKSADMHITHVASTGTPKNK